MFKQASQHDPDENFHDFSMTFRNKVPEHFHKAKYFIPLWHANVAFYLGEVLF